MKKLLAVLFLAAPVIAAGAQQSPASTPTVVIIVRHGEKAPSPPNDPPLSEVGAERARALAVALADAKVDVVMHTPTRRTRDTAMPTAERFGLTPQVLPLGPMAQHANAVAEAVRAHAGKTILVVGHSNTIMSYIAALGGPKRGELCDHEYDGLYTLVIDGSSVRLIEGHYGPDDPTPTVACERMTPRP